MTNKFPETKALTAREEGTVLLLVILILTLISVLILSWAQEWRTELKLASNFGEAHKCQRLAEAGIYYALGKLVDAKITEMKGLQAIAPQTQGASRRPLAGRPAAPCAGIAGWRGGDQGRRRRRQDQPQPGA